MIITTEKYDSLKLDKIKRMLQVQQQTGQPMIFEIFIDGFVIINKTENIDLFDSYEDMIDSNTQSIEVLVYPSEKTRASRKYIFELKEKEKEKPVEKAPEKGLGAAEIDQMIESKIALARERWETDQLRKDLKVAEKNAEEAEEFIDRLMDELEHLRKKGGEQEKGNGNSENTFSKILSFIQEYAPNFMQNSWANREQQPALSGATAQNTPESVSFKKKENADPSASNQETSISEEEKNIIENAKLKQRKFSPDELHKIEFITEQLANHKNEIDGLYHALQTAKQNNEKIEKEHQGGGEKQ